MKKVVLKTCSIVLLMITMLPICIFGACSNYTKKEICLGNVQLNECFDIRLKSYSGTAFCWDYEIDANGGVQNVNCEYVPPNDNQDWIAGGELVYTFKATKEGNHKIVFYLYDRSQKNSTIVEKIKYTISIIK